MYLISPDVKNLAMWRFHVAGCLPSASSQLLNGGENKRGAFWCCQMFRTSFGAATGWNSRNAMEPGTQMYPGASQKVVHGERWCGYNQNIILQLISNICTLSCVYLYYCFSVRSPIRWAIELGKLVLHCGCLRMFATIIFDDALWCSMMLMSLNCLNVACRCIFHLDLSWRSKSDSEWTMWAMLCPTYGGRRRCDSRRLCSCTRPGWVGKPYREEGEAFVTCDDCQRRSKGWNV